MRIQLDSKVKDIFAKCQAEQVCLSRFTSDLEKELSQESAKTGIVKAILAQTGSAGMNGISSSSHLQLACKSQMPGSGGRVAATQAVGHLGLPWSKARHSAQLQRHLSHRHNSHQSQVALHCEPGAGRQS